MFEKQLDALSAQNRRRRLTFFQSAPEARIESGKRSFINFASNNYLGLATDPRVKEAAKNAIEQWGAGATASRLLGGSLEEHAKLETDLAAFKGTQACAVFPSGYHVNAGFLPALLEPVDTVFLDRLCHASLVDGARLSKASFKVFRHNDPEHLDHLLARRTAGVSWVVTESIFSMDGDAAPLRDIVDVARRHGAHVYVDEAHGTGVYGPGGRGLVNSLGLEKEVDVCMGTLSKALGSAGGFVCGRRDVIEWAHNRSRSFIYSTALPPASAAAARAALAICRDEEWRREKLFALSRRLRAGLDLDPYGGPIVPWVVGEDAAALAAAAKLEEAGIFAPAIRPPTVHEGTSRIRFSLTALHEETDIDETIEAIRSTFSPLGERGTKSF